MTNHCQHAVQMVFSLMYIFLRQTPPSVHCAQCVWSPHKKSYCFNAENLQIPIPTAIIVRPNNNITSVFHLARIFWGSPDVDHETYWSVWSCAPIHSVLYFSWLDFHLDAIRSSKELSVGYEGSLFRTFVQFQRNSKSSVEGRFPMIYSESHLQYIQC